MPRWWVDRFTDEIKDLVIKQRELVAKRDAIKNSIKSGEAFFAARLNKPNATELQKGAQRMLELISSLEAIDKDIENVNMAIVCSSEAYLGNFIGKVKMPERLSDAGDLIKHDVVYAVPFNSGVSDVREVTPDDIWFLKIIKQAFKATNVTFVDKEDV